MKKIIVLLLLTQTLQAQHRNIDLVDTGVNTSIRGLNVVDDSIAWVSGSNGWVGVSKNGGRLWNFKQVPGFEKSDFRSIYAFSKTKAVIANAGSPASILVTIDGGVTWKEVYHDDRKEAFIDGVDFWNANEGLMYGDPLNGRVMILQTSDGGNSWKELEENQRPIVSAGEASFAASGTGLRCSSGKVITVATGGVVSRLLKSNDYGKHWQVLQIPIVQGKPSTGIFSFAFRDNKRGVVVGGDYLIDSLKLNHVFYTSDGGNKWSVPTHPTRGYRECVEFADTNTAVAVGPSGSDVSYDGGLNWQALSDEKGFHVVRKARGGSLVLFAGAKGKIGLFK